MWYGIDTLEILWRPTRKHLRQRWRALSEEDVDQIDGDTDILIELLRERYGYTRQQAADEVAQFIQKIEREELGKA
jgi:hypothetical protein